MVWLGLVPKGDAGVIIPAGNLALVPALVLDFDFERIGESDRIGQIPAIHTVVALLILEVTAGGIGKKPTKTPTRPIFVLRAG